MDQSSTSPCSSWVNCIMNFIDSNVTINLGNTSVHLFLTTSELTAKILFCSSSNLSAHTHTYKIYIYIHTYINIDWYILILVSHLCSIQMWQHYFEFFFLRATPAAYGSSQVELELQLPAYATATATTDLSCIFSLHSSSHQCWILNPLSGARNRTGILRDKSWVCYHWATTGTPRQHYFEILVLYVRYPYERSKINLE